MGQTGQTKRRLTQGITAAHNFKVINLLLLEGMGAGERVHSRNFGVGGYDWSIFLPEGITTAHADKVSAFLNPRRGGQG